MDFTDELTKLVAECLSGVPIATKVDFDALAEWFIKDTGITDDVKAIIVFLVGASLHAYVEGMARGMEVTSNAERPSSEEKT